MKKHIALAALLMIVCTVFSQPERGERIEMLEKKRMDYINTNAGLTESEAKAYWSLDEEARSKKMALLEDGERMERGMDLEQMSDKEIEEKLLAGVDKKVKAAQVDQDYAPQFIKAIGARKFAAVLKAEKQFRREVLREMKGERGDRPDGPRPPRPAPGY
jgi:hypothetical protein